MNIQKLTEQHIDNYSYMDNIILSYRRQRMHILENSESRNQESIEVQKIAAEISNMLNTLLQ